MATFILIPEQIQPQIVVGPVAIPAVVNAMTVQIKMVSIVFGFDNTLSFRYFVEESLDGGVTWFPASGFPSSSVGGFAGAVGKGGAILDGLPSIQYAYDGIAKDLRMTGSPFVGGIPGSLVEGILPGSTPGSFDWGLTATIV